EALLHFAARREHWKRIIQPALNAGQWVISDRFADSTMAYQGYGQGLGRDAVETLARVVLEGAKPALTLLLDLPPEEGLRRAADRHPDLPLLAPGGLYESDDRYERMGLAFHETIRNAFRAIAEAEPARV